MAILNSKKTQNAQSNISTGDIFSTHNTDAIIVGISGTSTSFTIQFEGSLDNINYFPIGGSKLSDMATFSITTSTLNEGWEFDVSALASFRANLIAIANGNITVVVNSAV